MVVWLVLIGPELEWERLSSEWVNEREESFFHGESSVAFWQHWGMLSPSRQPEPGSSDNWMQVEKAADMAVSVDRRHVNSLHFLWGRQHTDCCSHFSDEETETWSGVQWFSPLGIPRKEQNLTENLIPTPYSVYCQQLPGHPSSQHLLKYLERRSTEVGF